MKKEYDAITAFHYASFRPVLHPKILKKALGDQNFGFGLDIGSGTGHSTLALAAFCEHVLGIDPSASMLAKAIKHPKISYKPFDKIKIDSAKNHFEIITLAGSLWYAKSQQLVNELVRVCKPNAIVLVYDFELVLHILLEKLGFVEDNETKEQYNHQEDFSGFNTLNLILKSKESEKTKIQLSVLQTAHIFLSVKSWYTFFAIKYAGNDVFQTLLKELTKLTVTGSFEFDVNTFFTLYQMQNN